MVLYKRETRLANVQEEKSAVRARTKSNMLASLDRDQPYYIIGYIGHSDRSADLGFTHPFRLVSHVILKVFSNFPTRKSCAAKLLF